MTSNVGHEVEEGNWLVPTGRTCVAVTHIGTILVLVAMIWQVEEVRIALDRHYPTKPVAVDGFIRAPGTSLPTASPSLVGSSTRRPFAYRSVPPSTSTRLGAQSSKPRPSKTMAKRTTKDIFLGVNKQVIGDTPADGDESWKDVCAIEKNRSHTTPTSESVPDPWLANWARGENWTLALTRLGELLHARGTLCSARRPCKVHDRGSLKFSVCMSPRDQSATLCELFVGGRHKGRIQELRNTSLRTFVKACSWGVQPRCFDFDLLEVKRFFGTIRKTIQRDEQTFPAAKVERCAVVGNGHNLRCGEDHGAAIDSDAYSSVWRSGRYPQHVNSGLFSRKTGIRTTYAHRNCLEAHGGGNPEKNNMVCLSGMSFRNTMANSISIGAGRSEGFIVDLAIGVCKKVELYGFGNFVSEDSDDLVDLSWSDSWVSPTCNKDLQCLNDVLDVSVDPSVGAAKQYCHFNEVCDTVWKSGPKSPDPMDWFFRYELRLHILDAFGFVRWIWWA